MLKGEGNMRLLTKADWQIEVDALFHYLQVERGLTFEEAMAMIRLLAMGDKQPISQS